MPTTKTPPRVPFTYLVLSAHMDGELWAELEQSQPGDILEGFLEMESSAQSLDDLWPYGWEQRMARLAPVQMTEYVDARPWWVAGMGPTRYAVDKTSGYPGTIVYYPPPVAVAELPKAWKKETPDRHRFVAILEATAELAQLRGDGLLLIGCWGFRFGDEVPADQQAIMIQAGFQFVDRRP
jgi:hypothetical protein